LLGTIGLRHMPACRAGLRGVAWVDYDDLATTPHLLVLQHASERAPALIQDGFIQSGLVCDMAPWLLHRAFGRPRQIPYLQILQDDDRVVFAGLGTEFMQGVVAAIGNADIELGDTLLLLLLVLGVCDHSEIAGLIDCQDFVPHEATSVGPSDELCPRRTMRLQSIFVALAYLMARRMMAHERILD